MMPQLVPTTDSQLSEQTFYATHSTASDPGQYAPLLENLTADFAALSQVVQGLIYHYMAGPYLHGYHPSQERLKEIDTRLVERMVGRLLELDNRPLTEPRDFEKRLVGCCRDFSLFTCAVLRQHHIPARLRYGFASFFVPEYWFDHVIVEAWNGSFWQRFDPQVTNGTDKMMLPDSDFLTGGRAWQLWRNGEINPARFGLGPGDPEYSGVWFMRSRLLLDVAALNKQELLCWDQWGFGDSRDEHLTAADDALLDQVAARSAYGDASAVRELSATQAGLRVPDTVACFSPAVGLHAVAV